MNINIIRSYLFKKIGSKIVIIYYGGRNKNDKYEGVLTNSYHNIFTIKLVNGEIKSFSYCDILTKTIQIYI